MLVDDRPVREDLATGRDRAGEPPGAELPGVTPKEFFQGKSRTLRSAGAWRLAAHRMFVRKAGDAPVT